MADETRTALGSARERFVRGLPERGRELGELARALTTTPGDGQLLELLRKRLHALYASAQVFQDQALLSAISAVSAGLDAPRDQRPLDAAAIAPLLRLCEALGAGGGAASSPDAAPDAERLGALARRGRWGSSPRNEAASEPSSVSDAPVAIVRTVAGTASSPDLIAVLLLAGPEIEREVRAALPPEQCELASTSEPETALSVIDQVAPDVVLLELEYLVKGGDALVRGLRGGRAAGVRAVVAIVPERQSDVEALTARGRVDAVLRLPLGRAGLFERLLRLAGRGPRAAGGIALLDAGTVDDIARGVAEEVRRGISDSLRLGRGERIELRDKSELMAAAWSAVARIRAHLAEQAEGRVRFDEAPYAGGPAALALTGRLAAAGTAAEAALRGRLILVADDDPAVRSVFASLLRNAGARVVEAGDGRQALERARREPPDLVVSDILMPEVDGFSLCRELKRDGALSHVPVILLSWKEDFLQRMRELESGATGYLRKEADSAQILATVGEALRPRAELAALLEAGGEVQGRIDGLGVPVVLATVAASLPDARITLRDAWNLFEVDIRGGDKLAVTRTAADGSFARGAAALKQLLGVDVGRFSAVPAEGSLRGAFAEPLATLIDEGTKRLAAVLDAVSDSRLVRAHRIELDDEVLSPLLSATPTALAELAAKLRAGESVKELIVSSAYAARELEQHLRELARRGAISEVWSEEGEDLVASARRAREEQPGALMHGGSRPAGFEALPQSGAPPAADWVRPRREVVMAALPESGSGSETGSAAADAAPRPEPEKAASELPRVAVPVPAPQSAAPAPEPPRPPAPSALRSKPPETFTVQSALLQSSGVAPSLRPRGAPRSQPAAPPSQLGLWLTLAAFLALGFFGWRALRPHLAPPPPPASARARPPSPQAAVASPSPLQAQAGAGALAARGTPAPSPQSDEGGGESSGKATGSRVLPFIDASRGVPVAPDQGLLVVESGAGAAPSVRIAGRELGRAPLATALPAGRHELRLQRGDQTSFRYVVIRPGETRIVRLEPP